MTMQEILAEREQQRQIAQNTASSEIGLIIDELQAVGITDLSIEFAGSGDSGSIEDVYPDPGVLRERVEDWAYKVLEGTGVDWYNNDGGHGEITIDVEKRTFEYVVNQYETNSVEAASGKYGVTSNNSIRLET